jgi:hypothetical protein
MVAQEFLVLLVGVQIPAGLLLSGLGVYQPVAISTH